MCAACAAARLSGPSYTKRYADSALPRGLNLPPPPSRRARPLNVRSVGVDLGRVFRLAGGVRGGSGGEGSLFRLLLLVLVLVVSLRQG